MDQPKLTRDELRQKLRNKLKTSQDARKTMVMHENDLVKKEVPDTLAYEILEYMKIHKKAPFTDEQLLSFKKLSKKQINRVIEELWKNSPDIQPIFYEN